MWSTAKNLVLKSGEKKPGDADDHGSQQLEEGDKAEVESPRGTQAMKSLFGLVQNFTKGKPPTNYKARAYHQTFNDRKTGTSEKN